MTSHDKTAAPRASLPKIHNVCVVGGSGFVGHHIVHVLQKQGYAVRVPTRRRERAKDLIVLPGVDVVEANVHDPAELEKLFNGMDAVINLTGILHETRLGRTDKPEARRGDFHEVHVELPRKIVHACGKQGIRRLVHMSALNADATALSTYLRSKGAGEAIVMEAAMPHADNERWYLDGPKFVRGQQLEVTVFRPSVIFGKEDSFLNQFASLLRRLPVMPLACGEARIQPIYVEDVARVFVDSLENAATFGQRYDLCGPKIYTLRELVEYVSNLHGRYRWIFSLNDRLSYLQAWMLEWLPGKMMTRDDYFSLRGDSVCKCDFPALFGFKPQAVEVVAPKYLAPESVHSHYDNYRGNARR